MALNDRKGGMVARVRVSPKDCLGIIDVIRAAGMDPYMHSFSGCVSIALSSLIAVARRAAIIKGEEDGFQYLNTMEPFLDQASSRKKRELTNQLYERAVQGLEAPTPPMQALQPTYDIREGKDPALLYEYEELKKDMVGGDPTPEVLERFMYLQGLLF